MLVAVLNWAQTKVSQHPADRETSAHLHPEWIMLDTNLMLQSDFTHQHWRHTRDVDFRFDVLNGIALLSVQLYEVDIDNG